MFEQIQQHAGSANTADELLSIAQTCELLKIKPRTLSDWRAARAIRCIERPGFVRFRRSDVEAFLTRHCVEAAADCRRRPRRKTPQVH